MSIDWDEQPLGKISDRELAKKLNASPSTVRNQRTKRGIPPSNDDGAAKGINWDEQPLGEIPDDELAEQLGVATVSVSQARRRRGIGRAFRGDSGFDSDSD